MKKSIKAVTASRLYSLSQAVILRFAHLFGVQRTKVSEPGPMISNAHGGVTPAAEPPAAPTLPEVPSRPSPPASGPKLRKIAPAQGEGEDPDDEMRGNSLVARARREEQARMAAIVQSPVGLKQPKLAYAVAFHSAMPVSEALAFLAGTATSEFSHLNGIGLTYRDGDWLQVRAAQGVSRYRPTAVQ